MIKKAKDFPLNTTRCALPFVLFLSALPAQANVDGAEEGDVVVDFSLRYRLEQVETDLTPADATASTLRARLNWKNNISDSLNIFAEFDHVSTVGDDDYNSVINAKTEYRVIADPEGSDLNQFFITWKSSTDTLLKFGRHRINHDDQRFVGGVGWRQNEQTFDGITLNTKLGSNIDFTTSYVFKVNSIFGSDVPFKGDFVFANAKFHISESQSVSAFLYSLDYEVASDNSSQTLGLQYLFNHETADASKFGLKVRFAQQEDTGDSSLSYSSDYINAEFKVSKNNIWATIGNEILGSDNDVGFSTRLATLHKFNGFTDSFLGTPSNGLNDLYLKAGTKVSGYKLMFGYHDFSSDVGSVDFGDEINFVLSRKVSNNMNILGKFGIFSPDDDTSDVEKFWFMVGYDF